MVGLTAFKYIKNRTAAYFFIGGPYTCLHQGYSPKVKKKRWSETI